MKAQRVNLSIIDSDVEKLKKIYEERYLPYRTGDRLSFTGFCSMLLMFSAGIIEDTDYVFSYAPVVRRPGRPKTEGDEDE